MACKMDKGFYGHMKVSVPKRFPAQTDIKVSVKGDQAGAQASCVLSGWTEAI